MTLLSMCYVAENDLFWTATTRAPGCVVAGCRGTNTWLEVQFNEASVHRRRRTTPVTSARRSTRFVLSLMSTICDTRSQPLTGHRARPPRQSAMCGRGTANAYSRPKRIFRRICVDEVTEDAIKASTIADILKRRAEEAEHDDATSRRLQVTQCGSAQPKTRRPPALTSAPSCTPAAVNCRR